MHLSVGEAPVDLLAFGYANAWLRPCGMCGGTTIASQLERLIMRLDGARVCDDCITDRLNLSVRSQANVVTRGLGGIGGYQRDKAECALCARTKTVIWHRS